MSHPPAYLKFNRTDRLCLRTIVGSVLLITASPYTTGCVAPSDSASVMSYELDGTWCSTATPVETCLTVRSTHSTGLPWARYFWTLPTCQETGTLSGGLEFSPDATSRLCLAPDPYLYSASAYWSASGLSIEVDQSPTECRIDTECKSETVKLELHYVSYQENENGNP
jgi:hypothetical protein